MNPQSKIATIVPLKHLDLIQDDDYFMALSYAASKPEYVEFFRRRVAEGKFVMMDNSAVELTEPESFETYLDKALAVQANQIMLPDWFQDAARTVQAAKSGLIDLETMFDKQGWQPGVMVVPQGHGIDEWRDCLLRLLGVLFLHLPNASYRPLAVGISCRYTDLFGGTRAPAFRIAKQILTEEYEGAPIKIHFLGCWANPEDDVAPFIEDPIFQGVDSSYPSVYAWHGYKLNKSRFAMPRPPREIDFIYDHYDSRLLKDNISTWRTACLPKL